MTETKEAANLRSPRVMLSYPHLFIPNRAPGSDRDLYSCTLVFDSEAQGTAEFATMKAEANRVLRERFGAQTEMLFKAGQLRSPFIDGNIHAVKNPEFAGKVLIRCSSKMKPGVVDRALRPITDESKIYPGCFVFASLNCYAYPNASATGPATGNKGVSFGLRNIQFVADGTPLGGRSRPDDDFTSLDGDAFVADQREAAGGKEQMF